MWSGEIERRLWQINLFFNNSKTEMWSMRMKEAKLGNSRKQCFHWIL